MMTSGMRDLIDDDDSKPVKEEQQQQQQTSLSSMAAAAGNDSKKKSSSSKKKEEGAIFKRPEGMHRELYNLLVDDAKGHDMSPLVPTLAPPKLTAAYRKPKAKLGLRKARRWVWSEFDNAGRQDDLKLCHWQRIDRMNPNEMYPFARFNKVINVPTYTSEEYEMALACDKWSKSKTDHLFDLCRRFDLRWPIIVDRWDRELHPLTHTMEEMKDRFYNVCNALNRMRETGAEPICYDAEHERRRKEQLVKLWNRSKEEVEEEESLLLEQKKIEARRRERERKAQDLQKLITAADRLPISVNSVSVSPSANLVKNRKTFKNKSGFSTANLLSVSALGEHAGVKFAEFRSQGPHLRSQEMKIPTNIGQKKFKAIEKVIDKLKLELMPMATEEIVRDYNDLRSDISLLFEMKTALETSEFELQSLRNRSLNLTAVEPFAIPPRCRLVCPSEPNTTDTDISLMPSSSRRLTQCIDLTTPGLPSKKRKLLPTSSDQSSLVKRLRRQQQQQH